MNNDHLEIIYKLGFTEESMIETIGRLSISDQFSKSKKRCGIYCFRKENDTYYIGQAVDVVRRFSQHNMNHDNIENLWFQPVAKKKLDDVEKDLIFKAEESGLPIVNRSFVSSIIGETDLDLLLDQKIQEQWLNNHDNELKDEIRVNPPEKYRIRYRDSFLKLKKSENYTVLKEILKTYITNCIPYPRKTEMSFWEVTCLPSTNASSSPRYFCLNINFMEVFVVGYIPSTNESGAFINTSKEKYFMGEKPEEIGLENNYTTLAYKFDLGYKAAGYDVVCCKFSSLKELKSFITEKRFIDSAKQFNLRLMRKGGTIYSRYHCFDFVDDVLG